MNNDLYINTQKKKTHRSEAIRHSKWKFRNFTLLELMIVVAIIVILIALLLPALSNVRKKADRIQCSANIKTLLQIHMGYTMEQNGLFPAGTVSGNTYGHHWVTLIPLSSAGIMAPETNAYNWKTFGKKLTCKDNSGWWGASTERLTNTILSYAVNNYASNKAKKIEKVKRPSYAGYFIEGYIFYGNSTAFTQTLAAGYCYLDIHGQGTSAGFVDGHTEYINSSKFQTVDKNRFSYGVYQE